MKKTKLAAIMIAATVAMSGVSSAVVLSLNAFANGSVGLIGLQGNTAQAGRAIFITSTTDISGAIFSNLNSLLAGVSPTTSATFNAALAAAIGGTSATSPGIVRTANFAAGAISSLGNTELGAVANNTYFVLVSETAGNVNGFGAYRGTAVPSLGAVTFNPTNAQDGIGIGTSVLASGVGFQLAPVVIIPEPSAALLGAIGALGLLRRRRI